MAIFGESIVLGFEEAGQDLAGSGAGVVLTGESTLAWLSPKEVAAGRKGRVESV